MDLLKVDFLEAIYKAQKEKHLSGKWIHYAHISPLIKKLSFKAKQEVIGHSEKNVPIHSFQFGSGPKKILIWSQMHGNESTGTKALFDLMNCLAYSTDSIIKDVLSSCTILCIPMLNPDGSLNYTRVNANDVDLNRDAVERKAIESILLRRILETFNPDFCFNLHDQRTIFGVEGTQNPATISFLAPSEELTRKLTAGRIATMNVIIAMNSTLQKLIPNHIGRYTDEFYPTATGDNFQKLGYNTVLIEAGHYPDDYEREEVRKFNFFALLQGIQHISTSNTFEEYEAYFDIPNNQENFFDVIESNTDTGLDYGYQYVDYIEGNQLSRRIKLEKEGDLSSFIAHKRIFIKK